MTESDKNARPEGAAGVFFIQGITQDGKRFRPSDWADRLCGVIQSCCEAPGGARSRGGFGDYASPVMLDGEIAVQVSEGLRAVSPMGYEFVVSFARDNGLRVAKPSEAPKLEGPVGERAEPAPSEALSGATRSFRLR